MQTSDPTTPSTVTTKVVVATTVALTFITFWQAAAVVLNDLASTMFYIGGITEQAIGKPAPVDGAGRHAVQLRGALGLHGKLRHVRARRRLHRGQGQHRPHGCEALGLLAGRGLCSHRPHQRRQRGPVSGAPAQRYGGDAASKLAHRSEYVCGFLQRGGHRLLLVQQYQRRSGIQPQSSAHYADHHGDGGDHPESGRPLR